VVLGAFVTARTVAAADVAAAVGAARGGVELVDGEAMEGWLSEVATRVARVGWVFMVPDGTAFGVRWPKLAAAHGVA